MCPSLIVIVRLDGGDMLVPNGRKHILNRRAVMIPMDQNDMYLLSEDIEQIDNHVPGFPAGQTMKV